MNNYYFSKDRYLSTYDSLLKYFLYTSLALELYGLIVMFFAFMSTTVPTLVSSTNFA